MQVREQDKSLVLTDVKDFNVGQIFDCGQAFRFRKVDDMVYEGIAFGKFLRVEQREDTVTLSPCTQEEFERIWKHYFDLETDYSYIKDIISVKYEVLKDAVAYGYGIRILKQDPWEMIISFIISANNNIPRIQNAIEKISERYGEPFEGPNGQLCYAFPKPEALAEASIEALRECGVGYRDKYIKASAQMIARGEVEIESVLTMPSKEAEKELLRLMGVGKKVADCILLFGFNQMHAFPVDTWVKKVVSKYFLSEGVSQKEILDFADSEFKNYAGYVQQYLFYYIREGNG